MNAKLQSMIDNSADNTFENGVDTNPGYVYIFGAGGGIGRAFCQLVARAYPHKKRVCFSHTPQLLAQECDEVYLLDYQDSASLEALGGTLTQLAELAPPDWVLIATGFLHNLQYLPEKTYRSLNAQHLQHAYQMNLIGPSMVLQALLNHWPKQPMVIGVLSARLGSVSDNQLGGWHSYRCSKAALNMMIKNIAIELSRKKSPVQIFAIQPGTTDTPLSQPFQAGLPASQLQTPDFTVQKIAQLLQNPLPSYHGNLVDFAGNLIAP